MTGVPDWLPADAWSGYIAMRKQIKKPLTERAQKMAIAKLLELREQGQDVEKVLEQSEFNCWQGLYAVKVEPRLLAGPPQLSVVLSTRSGQAWNLSNEGIVAKAKQLGLNPHPGESYEQIKNRVYKYLDEPKWWEQF